MSMRISKKQVLSDEISDTPDNIEGPPQGWLQKVFFYCTLSPSDLQLVISEHIESIDWDSRAESIARPLGMFATFVFYMLRLVQDSVVKPAYYKNSADKDAFDLSKSETLQGMSSLSRYSNSKIQVEKRRNIMFNTIDSTITCVLVCMVLMNMRIAYQFLFNQYRSYSLFNFDPEVDSPNLTKRSLTDLSKSYLKDMGKKGLWSMIKYFILMKVNKEMMDRELNDKYFYTLNKWSPTKFTTQLFIHFNPVNVCFLWLTNVSFASFLLVMVIWTTFRFVIQDRYEVRLTDESIITAALVDQMNKKMIQNRTNKYYQNVLVDATNKRTPFVRFEPAITHNPIFQTHSLNGDLIRERFNRKIHQFEDVSDDTITKNTIPNSRSSP